MLLSHHSLLKGEQEQHHSKRLVNEVDTQSINLTLAVEKKVREDAMKKSDIAREAKEIDYTLNHDFMTENQQTEISMLAPHRVKPYHFKGFNEGQKAAVMHERAQQLKEQELLKKTKEEEDRLWAL